MDHAIEERARVGISAGKIVCDSQIAKGNLARELCGGAELNSVSSGRTYDLSLSRGRFPRRRAAFVEPWINAQ
jgi:hypothetical protein